MQSERHRLMPVLMLPEFLAVAGYQQQGIVRPRAEHKDCQDACALGVDGQVRSGRQDVDDGLCRKECDTCGQEWQQPQHRAPVGEQEDDDHHSRSGVQEFAVDTCEGLLRVGGESTRSGHVEGQSVRPVRRDPPDVVGTRTDGLPASSAGVDRYEHLECLAILRRDRPDDVTVDVLQVAVLRHLPGDRLLVGGGDAGRAFVHQHSRNLVRGRELRGRLQDLGGLGLTGQPRDSVVLLRTGQFARRTEGHRYCDDPQHQHDPFGHLAARQRREPSHSAHPQPRPLERHPSARRTDHDAPGTSVVAASDRVNDHSVVLRSPCVRLPARSLAQCSGCPAGAGGPFFGREIDEIADRVLQVAVVADLELERGGLLLEDAVRAAVSG